MDEYRGSERFKAQVGNEFPAEAASPIDSVTRRNFLKVMGASMAFAGATTGCPRQPYEAIFPYVQSPEEVIPGQAQYFATAFSLGGYGVGVLAESHMGRPTKIEGHPGHPSSLGGTDIFAQASILGLYDPDRSRTVRRFDKASEWTRFVADVRGTLEKSRGEGARLLTRTVTSPTLAAQIQAFLDEYPDAKWYQHDPIGRENVREGARLAFGEVVDTLYDFEHAERVVSFDADFLISGPGRLRYARKYAARRDRDLPEAANGEEAASGGEGRAAVSLNRLYVFESTPTNTGTIADHRYSVRASQMEACIRYLAWKFEVVGDAPGGFGLEPETETDMDTESILDKIHEDLKENKGKSIVVVGDQHSAAAHALAHAINEKLGSVDSGGVVEHIEPVETRAGDESEDDALTALVRDMSDGNVNLMILLGGNPVYDTPGDTGFAEALESVEMRVHVGPYENETSELCHWHVPEAHYLETWGDVRGHDGTVTLIQPLIAPLYGGRSFGEVLSALADDTERPAYDVVRDYWRDSRPGVNFDHFWAQSLSDGWIAGTASKGISMNLKEMPGFTASESVRPSDPVAGKVEGLELTILPDPTIGDGTFANNAWLQELPKALTKLTWDNAVIVGVRLAAKLGLKNEDEVEVEVADQKIFGPVWIQPGQRKDSITVHLGYGRSRGGNVATRPDVQAKVNALNGDIAELEKLIAERESARDEKKLGSKKDELLRYRRGFNAYPLRTAESPWIRQNASISKTNPNRTWELAQTEEHYAMELLTTTGEKDADRFVKEATGRGIMKETTERGLFREHTAEAYNADSEVFHHGHHEPGDDITLYDLEEKKWDHGYQWAMTIDLNQCTGCNACVVACQSENNIPVVGKREVRKGREMQWIRVDRYYEGNLDDLKTHHQPLPCMQCENAPCELVCPVGATQHSKEGLNDMVYNRCIGTRYCSNNCPYKVRRFNFYNYSRTPMGREAEVYPESVKPMYNPDVTVRTRGVMEKCTYCVQRINLARIEAKKSGVPISDKDLRTACQQVCPSSAITFGDKNNPESAVAHRRKSHRHYSILADLNTRARTTYLARLTNPNPDIPSPDDTAPEAHA